MSNDIELTAAINFETNQASAGAAKQAVDAVANGAKNAADAVERVKPNPENSKAFEREGKSTEKSFAAINAATAVTEGGIRGIGEGIKNVVGQFPALQGFMGPVALILAAIAAWAKAIQMLIKNHGDLKKTQDELISGNYDAAVKRQAETYERLYLAIRRSSEERQRYADIEQAKDDAQLRSGLALLELEKARRYAGLSPDDELGRRTVDLDISTKRSTLQEQADARTSERDARTLAAKESEARVQILAKKQEEADLQDQMLRQQGQAGKYISAGQRDSGHWYTTPIAAQGVWEKVAEQMDKIAAKSTELFGKIKEAQDAQYTAQQAIIEIQGKREVLGIDKGTQGTQSITRQTNDFITGTDLDRDKGKQLQDLADQLEEAAASDSAVMRNWISNQIAAKQQENALNAAFMQQMIDLATENAKATQDALARAQRLN